MKIACYGVPGSFTEVATIDYAKTLTEPYKIVYLTALESVVDEVISGRCKYGVIPTENNTAGAVIGADDLIKANKLQVAADYWMPIVHSLLALPDAKLSNIKEVTSHWQALKQCEKYLHKLNPDIAVNPYEDTALACEFVSREGRMELAAIANGRCAEIYGLIELDKAIQDNKNNKTRFKVIMKEEKK